VRGLSRCRNMTGRRHIDSGPEMAPQRLEKIESAPGIGMVPEASNPQDMVHGSRLRVRDSG
jgi:hypothetical protein